MDTEFKLGFLARQTARANANAQSAQIAQSGSRPEGNDGNKTFEKTLSDKKLEADREKNNTAPKETDEARKREGPERKAERKTDNADGERKENAEAAKRKKDGGEVRAEAKGEPRKKTGAEVKEDAVPAADVKTEAPEGTAETQLEADVKPLPDDVSKELTEQLAEILGVSPEAIINALEKLNLKPEELTTPENVNKLIMEVNRFEEPAELLKTPHLSETRNEVMKAVSNALAKAESAALAAGEAGNTQTAETAGTDARMSQGEPDAAENTDGIARAVKPVQAEAPKAEGTAVKAQTGIAAEEAPIMREVRDESKPAEENRTQQQTTGRSVEAAARGAEAQTGGENQENPENKDGSGQRQETNQASRTMSVAQTAASQTSQTSQTSQASQASQASQTAQSHDMGGTAHTPIIIRSADETVAEVGGKTVSRSQQRSQAQGTEVLNQIIDKMKLEFKPGTTEMRINLRPDELGSITVKIVTESGHVTAEIVTENSKVKELVEGNLSTLKESLKQQGVDVGELSVSVGQQEGGDRMQHFMSGRTKSQARMSQIINRITDEEITLESVNYADSSKINGSTVDFSA